MEFIDIDTWNRKEYFNAYLGTDFPYINIGAQIDITNLYRFAKEKQISFYFAMVYASTKVANSIENFKYRFTKGRPFRIDQNLPVLTHLRPQEELFVMVDCPEAGGDIIRFCDEVKKRANGHIEGNGLAAVKGRTDIINYSCIPWVRYTHFILTIAKDGEDCNPKISWGKYWADGNRVCMTLSVQVHHGLMDGYHVGKYFEKLQQYLDGEEWAK
jgi:chloramphenicol O-acetyltransferase type A